MKKLLILLPIMAIMFSFVSCQPELKRNTFLKVSNAAVEETDTVIRNLQRAEDDLQNLRNTSCSKVRYVPVDPESFIRGDHFSSQGYWQAVYLNSDISMTVDSVTQSATFKQMFQAAAGKGKDIYDLSLTPGQFVAFCNQNRNWLKCQEYVLFLVETWDGEGHVIKLVMPNSFEKGGLKVLDRSVRGKDSWSSDYGFKIVYPSQE